MMSTEDFVRELDALLVRHKEDKYSSFDTRWVDVIRDCREMIITKEQEIIRLNRIIKDLQSLNAADKLKVEASQEIDIPTAMLDAVGYQD